MDFRPYQNEAFYWATRTLETLSGAGLLLAPGLGKTGVVLRIADYMRVVYGIDRVLVTAPAKVLHHWEEEQALWQTSLLVHQVSGSEQHRLSVLQNKQGIFVISHALLQWLIMLKVSKSGHFGMFVVDESSKFKTWMAKRTTAAKRLASVIPYRILMTGSPAPNSPTEMFPQQFLLDRGRTLGSKIGPFRERYCFRGGYENTDWIWDETLTGEFQNRIAPYYLRQDQDLLGLPPLVNNVVRFTLNQHAHTIYKRFEEELYCAMNESPDLWAFCGAQRYNLCRQLASGGYYDAAKIYHEIHKDKIEVLQGLVEETDGPVLVAYQFTGELKLIQQAFKFHVPVIKGGTSADETQDIIRRWQRGEIKVLAAQSAAISHGVNGLQHGGRTIIWFSLTNNPDDHYQFNLRLLRSGQQGTVIVHYLLAKGTIDAATYRVVMERMSEQEALLEYFKHDG